MRGAGCLLKRVWCVALDGPDGASHRSTRPRKAASRDTKNVSKRAAAVTKCGASTVRVTRPSARFCADAGRGARHGRRRKLWPNFFWPACGEFLSPGALEFLFFQKKNQKSVQSCPVAVITLTDDACGQRIGRTDARNRSHSVTFRGQSMCVSLESRRGNTNSRGRPRRHFALDAMADLAIFRGPHTIASGQSREQGLCASVAGSAVCSLPESSWRHSRYPPVRPSGRFRSSPARNPPPRRRKASPRSPRPTAPAPSRPKRSTPDIYRPPTSPPYVTANPRNFLALATRARRFRLPRPLPCPESGRSADLPIITANA